MRSRLSVDLTTLDWRTKSTRWRTDFAKMLRQNTNSRLLTSSWRLTSATLSPPRSA
jgi:hypothetical protein